MCVCLHVGTCVFAGTSSACTILCVSHFLCLFSVYIHVDHTINSPHDSHMTPEFSLFVWCLCM